MKIIDLLNKIANNEELPKKIKYDGDIYFLKSDAIFEFFTYKTIDYNKFNTDGERLGKTLFLDNCYMHLYSEVEIIEEPKKIKKIKVQDMKIQAESTGNYCYSISQPMKIMINKLNELIDEVNKLKEK